MDFISNKTKGSTESKTPTTTSAFFIWLTANSMPLLSTTSTVSLIPALSRTLKEELL